MVLMNLAVMLKRVVLLVILDLRLMKAERRMAAGRGAR
jgi:hypothetical protein